jgi:hypothetical protein
MKMNRLLLIAAFVFPANLFGQGMAVPTSINITEAKYSLDGEDKNGFDVILQGSEKDINSAWFNFLEEKYDFNLKSRRTTTSGEELKNAMWSDKFFAIQSVAVKDVSGTHMRMWLFFGSDIVLNSKVYPTETAIVKKIMKDFAKAYYIGAFNDELAAQTKVVVSKGKEVSGLNEDKAKTEKAIAKQQSAIETAEKKKIKYQGKIEKYESKIVGIDEDVDDSRQSIESKKSKVNQTSGEIVRESEKFEGVEAMRKIIKEKIAAVENL